MTDVKNPSGLHDNEPSHAVSHKALAGILWLGLQTLSNRGVALLAQIVLAYLLMPEDFGVLGLATTIITVFSTLIGLGVDQVLQQRGKWLHFWSTQALILSVILSVLTALLMLAAGPIAAHIYNNDKLLPLIWVSALGFPLQSLPIIPEVKLKAELRFKFLAVYGSFEFLLQQVLTIVFAWTGFGALSFVLPVPIAAVIKAIVFWRAAQISFLPLRRARGGWKIIRRGNGVLGSKLCNAAVDQGDYFVLGLIAPARIVGFYFFAFKLASMPMRILAMNFVNVLFPALVSFNHDPKKQLQAAMKTAGIIAFVVSPVCILQSAVAAPALNILFQDRWKDSILFLQILSFGLPLDAANWAAGAYLSAKGDFAKKFYLQLSFVPVFYLLVVCGGLAASATGVAMGVMLYYIIYPLSFSLVAFKDVEGGYAHIFRAYLTPYMVSMASFGTVYFLINHIFFVTNPFINIILIAAGGGTIYAGLAYLFMRPVLMDLVNRILQFLKHRKATRAG